MSNTKSDLLDKSTPAAAYGAFGRMQVVMAGFNLLLAYVQFPKLLAQLDADDATTSDYASTLTPANPAGLRAKFNALLAKLDTDAKPAGANYASLLTASADADIGTQWPKLLVKLDGDDVADNTYVAKNTLTFALTLDD